jgi:uncharacterized protein
MIFSNTPIDPSVLPQAEPLAYQALAPAWLKTSYISIVIFFVFLLIPVMILPLTKGGKYAGLYLIPVFWLLWFLISLWLTKKDFHYRGYSLRERDILYRRGVLFKSTTAIPFNRVQHVEIKQGPIARYFGLHTLVLYTAGGESSDLSIPGLEGDTAQQLKTFVIQKTTATDEQNDI